MVFGKLRIGVLLVIVAMACCGITQAEGGLLQRMKERREARQTETAGTVMAQGREVLVHVPDNIAVPGKRAMVVVLHGGMGNAGHIRRLLGMDKVADRDGFVVAYLNGSAASGKLGERFKAWNAGGGCCGQPWDKNVDDVGYIEAAVAQLVKTYGIDPAQVYGMGHSNGAMMTQRLMCQSDVYRAAVPVSGPLQLDVAGCPKAAGKRILAIHGADDANVPIAGGRGTKGFKAAEFRSQAQSRAAFEASGAQYELKVVEGADHSLATVDKVLAKVSGAGIGDTAAAYFGLGR